MCISGSTKENDKTSTHDIPDLSPTELDLATLGNRRGMDIASSKPGNVTPSPLLPIHALTHAQDVEPESTTELFDHVLKENGYQQEAPQESTARSSSYHAVPPPQPVNARPRDNNPQLPPFGPPPSPISSPTASRDQPGPYEPPESPSNHPQVASYFERRILPPPRPTLASLPRRATSGDIFDHRLATGANAGESGRLHLHLATLNGHSMITHSDGHQIMAVDQPHPELPLATPFALNMFVEDPLSRGPNAFTVRMTRPPILSASPAHLDPRLRRPRSSPGPETQASLRRFGAPLMTLMSGLSSHTIERPGIPYASSSYPENRLDSLGSLEDSWSLHDQTRGKLSRRGSYHFDQHGHTQLLYTTFHPSTSTRQATPPTRGEGARRPSLIEREFGMSRSVNEDHRARLDQAGALTAPRRSGIGRSVKSTRMGMACVICRKR